MTTLSRPGRRFAWLLTSTFMFVFGCGGESTRRNDDDAGEAGDTGATSGRGGSSGDTSTSGRGGSTGGSIGGSTVGSAGASEPGVDITFLPVQRPRPVDLLFMIDNSISMADKQAIFAEAIPVLLQRLIQPACVNEAGQVTGEQPCPAGSLPEFDALDNLHIGVITSSLGHHGSHDVCSDATDGRTPDDRAELLPGMRPDANPPLASWNDTGFLVWDPRAHDGTVINPHSPSGWGAPDGPGDARDLVAAFQNQVRAAGELGCGYESSLEAWYRFLIDPEPVIGLDNNGSENVRLAANATVLEQRAQFLRPDSVVGVIMLTDENDCSILDEDNQQGWLVSFKGGIQVNNWRMPDATASCLADPNSPCCRPCVVPPTVGCGDNLVEGCPDSSYLPISEDSMNLRCHHQKQRFGIDLLYPTSRYVDALTNRYIDPRLSGVPNIPNPLFTPSQAGTARLPTDVFLAGIVGVPWQDIATDESLSGSRTLGFLTATELAQKGRWDVILGDPERNVMPTDALLVESIDPRPIGAPHPLDYPGAAIAVPGSNGNSINGAELAVDPETRDDLQYACIFDLEAPLPCSSANAGGCDCNAEEFIKQSPLCEYPEGPNEDGTQIKAKAYPSVRHLEVLKGLGEQSMVASICPKNVTAMGEDPASDPDYGYNPAVRGIVDLVKRSVTGSCIEAEFPTEPSHGGDQLACPLVSFGTDCNCDPARGLSPLSASNEASIRAQLEDGGYCQPEPSCDSFCLCEVRELSSDALAVCLSDPAGGIDENGFCYLDAASDSTNPALLAACPEDRKRAIRFTGPEDRAQSSYFVACPLVR